jgi:hypothetical protein
MCSVLLPPGVKPIAVKYIISYHITWSGCTPRVREIVCVFVFNVCVCVGIVMCGCFGNVCTVH